MIDHDKDEKLCLIEELATEAMVEVVDQDKAAHVKVRACWAFTWVGMG